MHIDREHPEIHTQIGETQIQQDGPSAKRRCMSPVGDFKIQAESGSPGSDFANPLIGEELVVCPLCNASMPQRDINAHIDHEHPEVIDAPLEEAATERHGKALTTVLEVTPKQITPESAAIGMHDPCLIDDDHQKETMSKKLDDSILHHQGTSSVTALGEHQNYVLSSHALDVDDTSIQPAKGTSSVAFVDATPQLRELLARESSPKSVLSSQALGTSIQPAQDIASSVTVPTSMNLQFLDGQTSPVNSGIIATDLVVPAATKSEAIANEWPLPPQSQGVMMATPLADELKNAQTQALQHVAQASGQACAEVSKHQLNIKKTCSYHRRAIDGYLALGKPTDHGQQTRRNRIRADLQEASQCVLADMRSMLDASKQPTEKLRSAASEHIQHLDDVMAMLQYLRCEAVKTFEECAEKVDVDRHAAEATVASLESDISRVNCFVQCVAKEVSEETKVAKDVREKMVKSLQEQEERFVRANESLELNPAFAKVRKELGAWKKLVDEHKSQEESQAAFLQEWEKILQEIGMCKPQAPKPVEQQRKRFWSR
jgi:hypothetical protein